MISWVVITSMVLLAVGYRLYGGFVSRRMQLDDSQPAPSHTFNDGIDFVPAKAGLLLGQHFSAIAAAGPIVGPILACLWFGWAPALAWIILGAIFVGGVHDFTSLVASVRNKATSIGELVKQHISPTAKNLFLTFVWFTLIYIIIAFADITAQTFTAVTADVAFGPAVAASSVLYLLAAMVMGVLLYKFKLPLGPTTLVFLPLVLFIVWAGPHLPASILSFLGKVTAKQWGIFLLAYCFVASIIPMWLLLQPRGYLGGWLLYLTIAVGLIGALFGGFSIEYPAFNLDGIHSAANGKLLFPILFITIACGACSGFHSIVSAGTTSKQLYKETDAKPIAYGAMLLEGLVAVLAMATVMMFPKASPKLATDPNLIYANGLASYLGLIGIGFKTAFPFALLAFSTFVYDTLDVATRLARYIFEELFGLKGVIGGSIAAIVSLIPPLLFLMLTKEKAYLVAWPIFGTSNQMLASLSLLAITVWLVRTGRKAMWTAIPMVFMFLVTATSLVLQIKPLIVSINSIAAGKSASPDILISGICGAILLALSILVAISAARAAISGFNSRRTSQGLAAE